MALRASGKIGACGTSMDLKILLVPAMLLPPTLDDFDTYDRTVRHDNVMASL